MLTENLFFKVSFVYTGNIFCVKCFLKRKSCYFCNRFMEEKLNILLDSINKLLMRNGIKSMTMDDIAKGLGVSKKTLYKHFSDKSDVVFKTLDFYLNRDMKEQDEILNSEANAIDQLLEIMKHASDKIMDVHPSIHYDLEKYYPESWQLFQNYKFGYLFNKVYENLLKGIDEGLYRKNLNPAIIAKLHISRIDVFFDPSVFPEMNFAQVLVEAIHYHLRGIASEKGNEYLAEKFNNFNL
jgi:TetR/AcrR family transcriptional regulator, cholesterol catabolism regulator